MINLFSTSTWLEINQWTLNFRGKQWS